MPLERTDIEKIAWLARLAVDEEDIPDYQRDLSNILTLVEQMNTVDTDGIAPMAHPLDLAQRLRPDEVTETDQRELFQGSAVEVEDGLYLVPKVIE